jgi:hypothetical protein
MKLIAVFVLIFIGLIVLYSPAALAESCNQSQLKKDAYKVARRYIESISCETISSPKNLVALIPWKDCSDFDERYAARYALLWDGDIGCAGGSGTSIPHITILKLGAGSQFVVDPALSSPVRDFELPAQVFTRILRVKADRILLDALDWGPDDPHCCASVPVRILLKQDKKGNWKTVWKKKLKVRPKNRCK